MRDFSADDDDNLSLNDHDKNNTNPPSLLSLVQQTTSLIHDLKKDVVSSTPSSSSSSSSSASSESFVNQVLNELISIEESFSRQIKLILDHIVKGVKPTGVEQFEINRMFSGFKELHKHSSAVLASFKGAMEMGYAKMQGKMLEPMYAVASVFAQYVLEFSIYPKYVQNYCHSKKRYQELLQEKAYCEWFKVNPNKSSSSFLLTSSFFW